jgi:RNA polymerase sigma-70 factor (ECF subfamily)
VIGGSSSGIQTKSKESPARHQSFSYDYVQRLSAGDPEIQHDFVTHFSEVLRSKLYRVLGRQQLGEDARQETFLRVLRVLKRNGLESPERLGAFVNGVCNNVLAEEYRSTSRLSPVPEGYDAPGHDPDPEDQLVTEEQKQRVRRALDRLPTRDRTILRLLFFEEQERDEICRQYRIDDSHLRVWLHRAKLRFKREFLPG